jgi:hypothetical protein
LFTQRRKGAKPQRGLDLRGSPSLREKKEKTEIQEVKSCERLDFFAPVRRGGQAFASLRAKKQKIKARNKLSLLAHALKVLCLGV